jgi:hypothetical protein
MDVSRAVSEFVSLGRDLFRLLQAEGQAVSKLYLNILRTQLQILQAEITSLEIETNRKRLSGHSVQLNDELTGWWKRCRHEVEFYKDEERWMESVLAFVLVGLDLHETVIVIATPEHSEALQSALRVEDFQNERLLFFNPSVVASRFLTKDWPDKFRFIEVFNPILERARKTGRVRICTEMAAVLWAEGRKEAAMRLEELWNALDARDEFSLLCAYPQSRFLGEDGQQRQFEICTLHRHVNIQ